VFIYRTPSLNLREYFTQTGLCVYEIDDPALR
jgi:hypothetical protein